MKVFITGGAGYVGSALVPHLLEQGNEVTVFDTFWYGDTLVEHPQLTKIQGDLREKEKVLDVTKGHNAFIHLACISNDPSFDLDPELGRAINFETFPTILDAVRQNKGARFLYASSSSIYGVKTDPQVREEAIAEPLTDYARYKWECEQLLRQNGKSIEWTIVRPATVCGYAPRLRLDLMVNSFTMSALAKGTIPIRGGTQMRSNLHIQDMVKAYALLLGAPAQTIQGQAFNVGATNLSLTEIAQEVCHVVPASISYQPTNDTRSYQVNSDKIERVLGFRPKHTVREAIESIVDAFRAGKIERGEDNPLYYNTKRMKELAIR